MQTQKQIQIAAKYGDNLTEFTFNSANQKVTSYLIDGKIHFVAADVCKVLGYANPTAILKKILDTDEYLTYPIDRAGQKRELNLVNESGLYHLIFQSSKPNAKSFRRHVTEVVLPEIRKTGSYTVLPKEPAFFKGLKSQHINGRPMYIYQAIRGRIGFSTRSSSSYHRQRYPGHFVLNGRTLLVTKEFALHLLHQRQVINNRIVLREMQPVLPFNFGNPLLNN